MSERMVEKGTKFLHYYTMNLEKPIIDILVALKFLDESKVLPLKNYDIPEDGRVKPIFWAIKPRSYLERTEEWDEFPNGRWGPSKSAAFGDVNASYGLKRLQNSFNLNSKKKVWGEEIKGYKDVIHTFVSFLKGDIKRTPFSEHSGLAEETKTILPFLIFMNENLFLTINSQPKVNGVPSTDEVFGWGKKNGYVY